METTPTTTAQSYREVLRIAVMRRVWYAQIVSQFGDWLAINAIVSVVSFNLHGSTSQIAGVQMAGMLPLVLCGPLAGVYVDRWPLKPVLIASELVRAVLVCWLFFATTPWHIYLVLIAMSVASSFFVPAQTVAIRLYVPPAGLLPANALMQLASVGTRTIGPAAAGVLVASVGASICYAIDVVSFVVSAALIGSVAILRPPATGATAATVAAAAAAPPDRRAGKVREAWHDLLEGLALIRRGTPALLVAAMAFEMFMIGCFAPNVPTYMRDRWQAGAAEFGFTVAVGSLGMVAGGLLVGLSSKRVPIERALEKMVVLGLAVFGLGVLLLAAAPAVPVFAACYFTSGCGFTVVMTASRTLLQYETPPASMGRVSGATNSIIALAQVAGLVLSGVLAGAIGARPVFVLCSALAFGLSAWGAMAVVDRGAGRTSCSNASTAER